MAYWGSYCARELLNAAPNPLAQLPAAKASGVGMIDAGGTKWRCLCAMGPEAVCRCIYFQRNEYVNALLREPCRGQVSLWSVYTTLRTGL